MSAFVPGASGDSGDTEAALAAARQEAATLRGVLEAMRDALAAATARLDALESRVAGILPRDLPAGAEGALDHARGSRSVADWKLASWTPTASDDAVTGETLRVRREALGISQAAVAHAAHCSRGLVAEVERGKRRSAQTLAHLASVLDRLEAQARRN